MSAPDVDALRERIETGERGGSEADREALLEFSDELLLIPSEVGEYRHVKLLRHCTRMAEHAGGLVDALTDRDAAEDIVRIHREYENPETNRDYRVALRQFGRRLKPDEDGDPPPSLDWIPASTPSNYDPSPEAGQMLKWTDDVQPMLQATRNPRDAAAIAIAWDAGPRSGELQALSIGDVTDYEHGLQITVRGKMGKRTVGLVPSVPYLQRWLRQHPAADDPEAPLWSHLYEPEPISTARFLQLFKEAGSRAGVAQPVTPTNFRKSSASHLASRGMNQAHLEDHHGWSRGSEAASRYISIFSGDAGRELARAHGLEVAEESRPEPTAPVECPRCGQQTPREESSCIHCGQFVDKVAAQDQTNCEFCGAIIETYPEHLPECLAVSVDEDLTELAAEAREAADD